MLNLAPPQVNIKSKFVEVTQNDTRGLGFEWFLGNFLMANGNVIGSAGSQPTLTGVPTAANPSGAFPYGQATPPSQTDGQLTSGVRASAGSLPTLSPLATFTGILTDPQFRVVINALDQRDGAICLAKPR